MKVRKTVETKLSFASAPAAAAARFATASEIGDEHHDQMGDEPNVVGTHILIDIDQDQDARHKDAEQDIGPLRDRVCGVEIGVQEEINEQDDSWKKERKD